VAAVRAASTLPGVRFGDSTDVPAGTSGCFPSVSPCPKTSKGSNKAIAGRNLMIDFSK
jgi:hypothetical protein